MTVLNIMANEWDEKVLQSDKKVLVDFSATWCGPCKMLAPILEEFAGANEDVQVYKMDIDANQEFAVSKGIMSVPTLMVFEKGEMVNKAVGVLDIPALKTLISK